MARDERSISRAEARRRSRLAARGELPPEPESDEADERPSERPRGGLLGRLFPAAPPLTGRPDPLEGYEPGRLPRPIGERAFLLRTSPITWILPGVGAFVGYIASLSYGSGLLGLLGTFLLFGSLIAAGWFGWRRPSLYGVAAAIVGFVLATALVLWTFSQRGAGPDTFGIAAVGQLFVQALYLAGLGFLGGWYGGYLRRRSAHLSATRPTPRRRR